MLDTHNWCVCVRARTHTGNKLKCLFMCGVWGEQASNIMHVSKVDKSDIKAYEYTSNVSIILCSVLQYASVSVKALHVSNLYIHTVQVISKL
jgi:hypothetical protein